MFGVLGLSAECQVCRRVLRFSSRFGHSNRPRLRDPGAVRPGRRRIAGPANWSTAAAPRHRRRPRLAAVQVVPEGRNPAARRGVAAPRSDRKQRPPRRPGDCHQVPVATSPATRARSRWLVHQHRAAYELAGTVYSDFGHDERDVGLQATAPRARRAACSASASAATPSRATVDGAAAPVQRAGLDAALPSAAARAAARPGRPATTCCRSARLEGNKRVDLLVRAMAHVPEPVALIVVGEGTHAARSSSARPRKPGSSARVRFAGAVDDDALVSCTRGARRRSTRRSTRTTARDARGVSRRASRSSRRADSGGTLEFVERRRQRASCARRRRRRSARRWRGSPATAALARRLGDAGRDSRARITWDAVIDRLVSHG